MTTQLDIKKIKKDIEDDKKNIAYFEKIVAQ